MCLSSGRGNKKAKKESAKKNIVAERNRDIPKYVDENEGLKDFYDKKTVLLVRNPIDVAFVKRL